MTNDGRNVDFNSLILNINDRETINKIRTYEKLNKKLINAEHAVLFNETCINENLLPKYSDIYIYI